MQLRNKHIVTEKHTVKKGMQDGMDEEGRYYGESIYVTFFEFHSFVCVAHNLTTMLVRYSYLHQPLSSLLARID